MASKNSPCLTCTRTADPQACKNKQCEPWRKWWLAEWAKIHRPMKEAHHG